MASSLRSSVKGAYHATEIPFVFETVRAKYGEATSAEDEKLAAAANSYWTNFAKTGDPNGSGQPKWPGYSAAEDEIMDFTLAGPVAGPDPWKPRLDLLEKAASAPPAGR